jgi:hypothetical protein
MKLVPTLTPCFFRIHFITSAFNLQLLSLVLPYDLCLIPVTGQAFFHKRTDDTSTLFKSQTICPPKKKTEPLQSITNNPTPFIIVVINNHYHHYIRRLFKKLCPTLFFLAINKDRKVQFWRLVIWCFSRAHIEFRVILADCRAVVNF